ncbi:hypothetical protein [Rhodoligotrophos ferricapiens]|uniref:hypothetical protein n=1 Tax=Rhodoligotrophos ferricapiens TaxID=3069264 RepID=UPI00315C5937
MQTNTTTTLVEIIERLIPGPPGPMPFQFDPENVDWQPDVEYRAKTLIRHDFKYWYSLQRTTGVEPGTDDEVWFLFLDGASAAELSAAVEASEAARDKAEAWADADEDVEVEPGQYSAKHGAAKAEEARAATAQIAAEFVGTASAAVDAVNDARDDGLSQISTARMSALDAIGTDQAAAQQAIAGDRAEALEAIDSAEAATLGVIETAESGAVIAVDTTRDIAIDEMSDLAAIAGAWAESPEDVPVQPVNVSSILTAIGWDQERYPLQIFKRNGRWHSDFSRHRYIPDSMFQTTFWVDINRPDDNGDGLTPATAKRSIVGAILAGNATGAPYRINVLEGSYFRQRGFSNTLPTQAIGIYGYGKVVVHMSDILTYVQDATHANLYRATRSNVGRVFDLTQTDARGDYIELQQYADAATLNAAGGVSGWCLVNTDQLYVRRADGAAVTNENTRAMLTVPRNFAIGPNTGHVYMRGIDIEGGGVCMETATDNFPARVIMADDCTFKYSTVARNVRILTPGLTVFRRCVAAKAFADGFSSDWYKTDEREQFILYEDCEGWDNGNPKVTGTLTNSNQSHTGHDLSVAVDLNGNYPGGDRGQNIHYTHESRVALFGVSAADPTPDGVNQCVNLMISNTARGYAVDCNLTEGAQAIGSIGVAQSAQLHYKDLTYDGAVLVDTVGGAIFQELPDSDEEFSAFHWAKKAEGFADNAQVSAGHAAADMAAAQDAVNDALTIYGSMDAIDTAVGNSQAANASAQTAASNAAGYASIAQSASQSAVAVTGLSQLGERVSQISTASNVSAVYIYDTTKDSDGGEWRRKCKNRSWRNEPLNTATRGPRADFPQKALLVATSASTGEVLTIYDLDDPACPMWMRFDYTPSAWTGANMTFVGSGSLKSLSAMNGVVYLGASTTTAVGVTAIDFILDQCRGISNSPYFGGLYRGKITHRNDGRGFIGNSSSTGIPGTNPSVLPSAQVWCVAATVLPGTPRNSRRFGLPDPTVAVATNAGGTVIHWDGRVCVSNVAVQATFVAWADNALWLDRTGEQFTYQVPIAGLQVNPFVPERFWNTGLHSTINAGPHYLGITKTDMKAEGRRFFYGAAVGLSVMRAEDNPRNYDKGLAANITDKYNTGYMPDALRFALAESSADLTSLVEANILNDDFSAYTDTAAMEAAGWAGQFSAVIALNAQRLELISGGTNIARVSRQVSGLIPGQAYELAALVDKGTVTSGGLLLFASINANLGGAFAASSSTQSPATVGTITLSFIAPAASFYIGLGNTNTTATGSQFLDKIQLRRVTQDRTVAGYNFRAVGTINREVVAEGADVAAYSGFGPTNYLMADYNPALDFGTGDVFMAGWANLIPSSGVSKVLLDRSANAGGNLYPRILLYRSGASNTLALQLRNPAGNQTIQSSPFPIDDNRWHFVAACRRANGRIELYCDGEVWIGGVANTYDFSDPFGTAAVRLGVLTDESLPLTNGKLALWRMGAYCPSPTQIRQMYEAEKRLFEPNAKTLLPAGGVLSLSYDPDTNELGTGTPLGTAVYKDLQRIALVQSTFGKNKSFNSEFSDATPGNPGSLPFGVSLSARGLSYQVVGRGYENGLPYIDFRWFGTTTSAGGIQLALNTATSSAAAAVQGQTWTGGVTVKRIAGDLTPLTTPVYILAEQSGGGSQLTFSSTTLLTESARTTLTRTLSQANVASVRHLLQWNVANAVNVDVTLRIYAPQLEIAATPSAYEPSLSSNDNHKAVAIAAGIRVAASNNGVDAWQPAVAMRENLRKDVPSPVYDASRPNGQTVTFDAAATDIFKLPILEGQSIGFTADVSAREFGNTAGEAARYVIQGVARRGIGLSTAAPASIAVNATTTTIYETTATMDCIAAADTAAQALDITATGVAGKRLVWDVRLVIQDMAEVA